MNALWSDWNCRQQSTVQWTCVSVWLHPMSHGQHNTIYTAPQHLISSEEVHMQFPVWGGSFSATNGRCVVLTGVKILAICSKSTDTMLHQMQRLHIIRKAWLQHWHLAECHMMLQHTPINKITKVTTHSGQIRGQWTQHTAVATGATEDNQAVLLGCNMGR